MTVNDKGEKRRTKNLFTTEEDNKLRRLVESFASSKPNWDKIAQKLKNRTARQCRERYLNYLDPHVDLKAFTAQEDDLLLKIYEEYGKQWKLISTKFPGRTPNNVRNRIQVLLRQTRKEHDGSSKKPTKKEFSEPESLIEDSNHVFESKIDSIFKSYFDSSYELFEKNNDCSIFYDYLMM